MRVFILMAFMALMSLLCSHTPSYAQSEANALQENTEESKENIFDTATDEQIDEAQHFYKYCSKNETMRKRKDCKCATVSYLRTRLALGSKATTKEIMKHNVNTCLKDAARSKIDKTRASRDLSFITDKQLEEAELVFEHCQARRALSSQFDCECFAARFLDERLDIGPIANWDALFLRFRNECRNVVETTGIEYSTCMSRFGARDAVNMEPKEFCECYARKWAELFEGFQGSLSIDAKDTMKSRARSYCVDLDRYK